MLEGRRGRGEKERGRNTNQLAQLVCAPTRDQTFNPDVCPDWKSNLQPFIAQDDAQPTESLWLSQSLLIERGS